jgi:peptidoglycan/xylan/chitin deacetylase (PgdA/CDA1 family)
MRHELLFKVFSSPWVSLLERSAPEKCFRFYYHWVGEVPPPHLRHLYPCKTLKDFDRDLDYLLASYVPVSVLDLIDSVRGRRALPQNAFILTFDDGYREMAGVVAQHLLRRGVPATFFLNTAFIDNADMCYLNKASVLVERLRQAVWSGELAKEVSDILRVRVRDRGDASAAVLSVQYRDRDRLDHLAEVLGVEWAAYLRSEQPYLTREEIQRLIELGFAVGAHSIDHPLYRLLPLEEQLRQTIESTRTVRTAFNLPYGVFAFPHSDSGVGAEFFRAIADTGLVDLSFGTAGLLEDTAPFNLQRVSLEKPVASAEKIVRFHRARRLGRTLTGRASIARP